MALAAAGLRDAPAGKLVETESPSSVLPVFAFGLKAGLLTFGGAYTAIPVRSQ